MALDPTKIVVAPTGSLYLAPVGTAAPADTSTAWAAGWVEMGYLSEDAVTMSADSETVDIMAWQSSYPVWSNVRVGYSVQFQLMQWSLANAQFAFGGGTLTGAVYKFPAQAKYDPKALGMEVIDGSVVRRVVWHRVKVTELGDVMFKGDEAAVLDLTVKVQDNAGNEPITIVGGVTTAADEPESTSTSTTRKVA